MKTKMILGLCMRVFNDINKTCRKFHLHYVICFVPKVDPGPSDMEERCERNEGKCGGKVSVWGQFHYYPK